jgi:hypothetical protein
MVNASGWAALRSRKRWRDVAYWFERRNGGVLLPQGEGGRPKGGRMRVWGAAHVHEAAAND